MSSQTLNQMPNEQIVIKYLRETKYDDYMFEVIHLPLSEECYFKLREFRCRKYVYLPKKKVKCDSGLDKECYYNVHVKTWIVKHLAAMMKHFTLTIIEKPVDTCTITTDSDSD